LIYAIIKVTDLVQSLRFAFFWNSGKLGIQKYYIALIGLQIYEYVMKPGAFVGNIKPEI
jgi:hypothetical protein